MRGRKGTRNETIPGFTERLRQAIDEAHITQAELAARSGMDPSSMCHLVRYGRIPSMQNAVKIADALGVSLDWLCGTRKVEADSADVYRLKRIAESVVEGTRDTYACLKAMNVSARALVKWAEKYEIDLDSREGAACDGSLRAADRTR